MVGNPEQEWLLMQRRPKLVNCRKFNIPMCQVEAH
jgi:hypothetical protein